MVVALSPASADLGGVDHDHEVATVHVVARTSACACRAAAWRPGPPADRGTTSVASMTCQSCWRSPGRWAVRAHGIRHSTRSSKLDGADRTAASCAHQRMRGSSRDQVSLLRAVWTGQNCTGFGASLGRRAVSRRVRPWLDVPRGVTCDLRPPTDGARPDITSEESFVSGLARRQLPARTRPPAVPAQGGEHDTRRRSVRPRSSTESSGAGAATLTIRDNRTGQESYDDPDRGRHGEGRRPGPDQGSVRTRRGWRSYDPGFVNTASCRSSVTYIDGEKGILEYRGYPIEQLAEKSNVPRGLLPARCTGELPSP